MTVLGPRWRKVIRDIWDHKARTLLVVLAVAVGVFAFGSMFITREVLVENMNQGFTSSNPATITISLRPFDESLLRTARTFPYVEEVAARSTAQVQVWTGNTWLPLTLIAVPDFEQLSVNTLTLESGTFNLQRRQILFERQSLPRIEGAGIGDGVVIELPDNSQQRLVIAGTVHDFNAIPGSRAPLLTGYVSTDTLHLLGLPSDYTELLIVTDPALTTNEQLTTVSRTFVDLLERYGHTVTGVTVTEPGKHWASDLIDATVLVMVILGLLALTLSGFLVINTITSILAQQKRQVGMMKAVGATTADITGIYLAMSGVYGALALLIALPVGVLLSRGMTRILADFLNVDVFMFQIPGWIIALQAGTALITPLIAAFIPVVRTSRITVREAVSDYGIGGVVRQGAIDRLITAIRGLPRPTLLSLRNTFRRKGRLALTLATLATAGAIFISVLNTRAAIIHEFNQIIAMFGYDVQVLLSEPQPVSRLEREAMQIEGVERVEGWGFASGTIIRPDGVAVEPVPTPAHPGPQFSRRSELRDTGENEGTDLLIFAPPLDTPFIKPTMVEGRWLQPGDNNVIVISSEVLNKEPYIKVGDMLNVRMRGAVRQMEVVGVVNLIGIEFAYAPFDYITRLQGAAGQSFAAIIGTTSSDPDYQSALARRIEEQFQEAGIQVSQTLTPSNLIGVVISQIDFFVLFMLFMALLLGLVGGLGLMSTMSLNVLERTREIGVMRAIGASNRDIRSVFLTEGVLIGLISFVISSLLSLPITYGFVTGIGLAFFNRPMTLVLTPLGFGGWLGIVLVLAAAASLLPANRAAQVSVRESLAYE